MGDKWDMDQSVLCGYSRSGNGWWDIVHEWNHQGITLFLPSSSTWSIPFTVSTSISQLAEELHWTWERRYKNTIIYKSNRKLPCIMKGRVSPRPAAADEPASQDWGTPTVLHGLKLACYTFLRPSEGGLRSISNILEMISLIHQQVGQAKSTIFFSQDLQHQKEIKK